MNIGLVVQGLEFAIQHRKELAADAEACIHFIRRVEHLIVKHDTTADKILVASDEALAKVAENGKPLSKMNEPLPLNKKLASSSVD